MYVTSMEMRCCKYVANFHTSQAAEDFVAWLFENKYDKDERYINVKHRKRNSVVFLCHDRQSGYEIANEFEAFKLAQFEAEKAEQEAQVKEESVPPPVILNGFNLPNTAIGEAELEEDLSKIDLIVEEEAHNKDNVLNKIFSIRK